MYASGWVMASVRTLCSVARLAVMLATVPLSNRICTLATSERAEWTRGADRRDPPDLAVHQPEHDVDVVDHEVHDHRVVLHAGHERAEPAGLDQDRVGDDLPQLLDGPVEALDVADVQHHVALPGDPEELARLLEGRGQRLLHQHADARLQAVLRDLEVERRSARRSRPRPPCRRAPGSR